MYKSDDVDWAFQKINNWINAMFFDSVWCGYNEDVTDAAKAIREYVNLTKEKLKEKEM